MDHVNAYKNIPTAMADIHLQGFRWLGDILWENNKFLVRLMRFLHPIG
jgi:hypothetical protein